MSDAWTVWKDIAYPGRVHVPAADGRTHVYDFTPRDMALLEDSGNAKVADRWNIPVCWDHQDVEPNRAPAHAGVQLSQNPARDLALGVFARIKRFSRTPDGRLKALLAGSDPKDLDQLHKVGFVSPEIVWNWKDTDGKVWRGPSVTHLAATPRPVQRHQHPVGTDPDAPVPSLQRTNSLESLVRLSLTNSAKPVRVAARLRLSLDHYGGARPMPDSNFTPNEGTDTQSPWERIAAALLMAGVKIGDGKNVKDPSHLADLIEVACLNSQEVPEEDDDLPPEPDEDPNSPPAGDMEMPPEGAVEPQSPPVQMSLTAREKLLTERLVTAERAKLVARAEKVARSGALRPADGDELVEECRSVRLSLTAAGAVAPNNTTIKLAALEKVKPGATVNVKGPKSAKARLGQPANVRAAAKSEYEEDGEQDADAVVDAWDRT